MNITRFKKLAGIDKNLKESIKKDYLEFSEGIDDLEGYLSEENAQFYKKELNGNLFYIVENKFVVLFPENSEFQDVFEIDEFFFHVISRNLFYDLTNIDFREYFNKKFWKSVGGSSKYNKVFHATDPDNIDSILETGLHTERETFSLRNRNLSSVIFAVTDIYLLENGSYGEAIIEISIDDMKRDGFTPLVSMEPEFEDYHKKKVLAKKLDLKLTMKHRPSVSSGTWEETVLIHSDIPAKYLSVA